MRPTCFWSLEDAEEFRLQRLAAGDLRFVGGGLGGDAVCGLHQPGLLLPRALQIARRALVIGEIVGAIIVLANAGALARLGEIPADEVGGVPEALTAGAAIAGVAFVGVPRGVERLGVALRRGE